MSYVHLLRGELQVTTFSFSPHKGLEWKQRQYRPSATNDSSVGVLKFKKHAYYVNEPSRLSPKVPSKYRNLEILEIYPHWTAQHLQSRLCPSESQNKKSWIQKMGSPLKHPILPLFILKRLS